MQIAENEPFASSFHCMSACVTTRLDDMHPQVLIIECMIFCYEKGKRAVKTMNTARYSLKKRNSVHSFI